MFSAQLKLVFYHTLPKTMIFRVEKCISYWNVLSYPADRSRWLKLHGRSYQIRLGWRRARLLLSMPVTFVPWRCTIPFSLAYLVGSMNQSNVWPLRDDNLTKWKLCMLCFFSSMCQDLLRWCGITYDAYLVSWHPVWGLRGGKHTGQYARAIWLRDGPVSNADQGAKSV